MYQDISGAGLISLVNAAVLAVVAGRQLVLARRYRSLSRRLNLHVCPDRQVTVRQLRNRLAAEGEPSRMYPTVQRRPGHEIASDAETSHPPDPETTLPIDDLPHWQAWPAAAPDDQLRDLSA
jgi:hypothetical protein